MLGGLRSEYIHLINLCRSKVKRHYNLTTIIDQLDIRCHRRNPLIFKGKGTNHDPLIWLVICPMKAYIVLASFERAT